MRRWRSITRLETTAVIRETKDMLIRRKRWPTCIGRCHSERFLHFSGETTSLSLADVNHH